MSTSNSDITNYNYEDLISKRDLEKIVQTTLFQKDFKIEKVTLRPANDHKLGFLCDHLRLTAHVKLENDVKICKYFLKCVPIENKEKKDFLLNIGGFEKEKKVYAILDSLRTFVGKKPWYPACYFSNEKVILLEDLSLREFVSFDQYTVFTKKHCMTALASLARLHSSCFSVEEKRTKELGANFRLEKEYDEYLDPFYFEMTDYFIACMETMLAVTEKFSKYAQNQSTIDIIKSKWTSIWVKSFEMVKPSKVYRNVMVQRDVWGGNLMYRYENGIAKECIIVDYQTLGWQPPASDVLDVLYLNTTQKDRNLWESECIEYYFEELRKNLLESEITVENVLPKDVFMASCEEYKFWALLHSCCEHHLIRLNREVLDNITGDSKVFGTVMNTTDGRKEVVFKELENEKKYRDVVLENLEELIDNYILV